MCFLYIYILQGWVCLNWIDNIQNTAALHTGRLNYKSMCGLTLRLIRQRNPKLERATNRSDMCICVYMYICRYVYMYVCMFYHRLTISRTPALQTGRFNYARSRRACSGSGIQVWNGQATDLTCMCICV